MKILRNQRGFTLIELVLIIIILGVLAAVAIPRFVTLQSNAIASGNLGYIGGIRSGLSVRFSEELVTTTGSLPGPPVIPDVVTAAGPAVPGSATNANLQNLVTTPLPTGPTGTIAQGGAAAAPCVVGWQGLAPSTTGGAPGNQIWNICPGTAVGNPILISCTVAGFQC